MSREKPPAPKHTRANALLRWIENLAGRVSRLREFGVLCVLVGEILLFALLFEIVERGGDMPNPFLVPGNLLFFARATTVLAVAAIGSSMVIISGGIDLSVGSVIALSCVVTASVVKGVGGAGGIMLGLVAGLATGSACGACSAGLVTKAKLPPFIATLGMMSVARGLAFLITGGATIQIPHAYLLDFTESESLNNALRLVVPVLIFVVLAAAAAFALARLRWGRQVFATGGNEEAARFSGVRVERVKLFVYMSAGALAGASGVVFTGMYGTGQSTAAVGWELDAIAASVVGGASLSGGRGSVVGAVLGALIFTVLRNGLAMLDLAQYNLLIIGVVVILVVVIDQTVRRRT